MEPTQILSEMSEAEASVFLCGQPHESLQPVPALERHQVCGVTCLRPSEHGQDLVGSELQRCQGRDGLAHLGREEPGIGGKIDLGSVLRGLDDEPGEPGVDLDPAYVQARLT